MGDVGSLLIVGSVCGGQFGGSLGCVHHFNMVTMASGGLDGGVRDCRVVFAFPGFGESGIAYEDGFRGLLVISVAVKGQFSVMLGILGQCVMVVALFIGLDGFAGSDVHGLSFGDAVPELGGVVDIGADAVDSLFTVSVVVGGWLRVNGYLGRGVAAAAVSAGLGGHVGGDFRGHSFSGTVLGLG